MCTTIDYNIPVYGVRLVRERDVITDRPRIRGPEDVYTIISAYLDGVDREHFVILLLNTNHDIVGINTVTIGILDASVVHAREVFKPAILASAAAVILVHNHPSGDPAPSPEDRSITTQLAEAGRILGIPVLDHVVIGDGRYVSFAETGLMPSDAA